MNKRIKKKHLRIDNPKVSPYRLKLLYKQATYFLEKLPSLLVLTELIVNVFEIIRNVLTNVSLLLENKRGENNWT